VTEKEKMKKGELYNALDPELTAERASARKLCYKYNLISKERSTKKLKLISKLFSSTESCHIETPFSCDYGYNITYGKSFHTNYGCVIIDAGKVTMGDEVMFGPGVHIYTVIRPVDMTKRSAGFESSKPVTIGNQVWVGGHSTICPGVHIGSNVVIGAGSVVVNDIPDNAIAMGNPCEVIRLIGVILKNNK
jgi:maltose O-acetyltransferase